MLDDLLVRQWKRLSVRQRIELCRQHAREAEEMAAAHPDNRQDFARIAEQWTLLVAELEKSWARGHY